MAALGTKKRLQEKLRSMDRSALLHRRHVQSNNTTNGPSDSSQVDSMAADVTASMTRTKQSLREEIDKSILSYQIMERSTKRLQATNKKQVELGSSGVLGRTRQAMRELWRRERADQFWITAAFGVFAAAAFYVLSQRIWAPPVMTIARSGWEMFMKKEPVVLVENTPPVHNEMRKDDLHIEPAVVEEPAVVQTVKEPFDGVEEASEPFASAHPTSAEESALVTESEESLVAEPIIPTETNTFPITEATETLYTADPIEAHHTSTIIAEEPTSIVEVEETSVTTAPLMETALPDVSETVSIVEQSATSTVESSPSTTADIAPAAITTNDAIASVVPEPEVEASSVPESSMEDLVAAGTYDESSDEINGGAEDEEDAIDSVEADEAQDQPPENVEDTTHVEPTKIERMSHTTESNAPTEVVERGESSAPVEPSAPIEPTVSVAQEQPREPSEHQADEDLHTEL